MASNQQPDNENNPVDQVRAYPSLLAAYLKQKHVPAARLYLLLQALDQVGRGGFDVDQIRATFTSKKSKFYICGWRRLRQILNDGEGIFWQRDTAARLWLTSPARVAIALEVRGLHGQPVAIPTAALLGYLPFASVKVQ